MGDVIEHLVRHLGRRVLLSLRSSVHKKRGQVGIGPEVPGQETTMEGKNTANIYLDTTPVVPTLYPHLPLEFLQSSDCPSIQLLVYELSISLMIYD